MYEKSVNYDCSESVFCNLLLNVMFCSSNLLPIFFVFLLIVFIILILQTFYIDSVLIHILLLVDIYQHIFSHPNCMGNYVVSYFVSCFICYPYFVS